MTPFRTDRLPLVDPKVIGQGTFACVDRLQHIETAEHQLMSAAVLLLLYCHNLKAHPGDVLQVANNIIDRTIHMTPQLKGAMDYAKHEL